MRKDIMMRLERVNSLIEDQQFPQENFADFAKEKLNKMNLAIGGNGDSQLDRRTQQLL